MVKRLQFNRSPDQAVRCAATSVLLLSLSVGVASALPDLQPVSRSGFAMDLPAWPIETDQDNGASGRHVRIDGLLRAEVGWTLDGHADLAALDLAIDAIQKGHETSRVERLVERPPGQLRLFTLLDFGGRAWLAITQVACREAGVLVTVAAMAPKREHVQHLHGAILDSFACRSADLPKLVSAWPASDLPDDFGVWTDGSPVLMHRDGRWILIGTQASGTIADMGADLERARRVFAGYGEVMDADWMVQAPASEINNLSGPASSWSLDSPVLGMVAASTFVCGDGAAGYVFFAGDDSAQSNADALRALSARFGCPDLSAPSVLDRPSACAVGVIDMCER